MKKFYLITTVLSFLLSSKVTAQIDTEFWFAAPDVAAISGQSPVGLRIITYAQAATVTLSLPANGGFVPIVLTVAPYSTDVIVLTSFLSQIEPSAGDIVTNTGIKILATNPISCYYDLYAPGNKEYFGLKGKKALGTNFYTPFPTFWNNVVSTPANYSSFEIVATMANTTVLITPRTAIIGHAVNATFSIVLQQGQAYSGRDMDVLGSTTLSGSIISSNKPVAVTIFYGGAQFGGCIDLLGDQITNADFAGQDFVLHKSSGQNERAYLLGTENNTIVDINNGVVLPTSVINWSETKEIVLTSNITYVQTNKPCYMIHISGTGCELSAAQVPNLFCAGSYESAFSRTSIDTLSIVLYTRTGFEDDFTLTNNVSGNIPVLASQFQNVPGTLGAFKTARIYYSVAEVPVNSYTKVLNSGDIFGLGFENGGTLRGSAYQFISSFDSKPFVNSGPNSTVCANIDVPITGIVGGGSVTGIWTSNGFGTFSNANTTLVNSYNPSDLDTIVSPILLILTSTGPCPVKKDTIILSVTPSPVVNAGVDQLVCANNSLISLNGTIQGGATQGTWTTTGTGIFNSPITNLTNSYTPSSTDLLGTFKLILTSSNNGSCLAVSDTANMQVVQPALVNAGPTSISVCANSPFIPLNGTVSGITSTGKWLTNGTGAFLPNNQVLNGQYNPSVTDVNNGTITLTLESTFNGLCLAVTDQIIVIFTGNPIVNAGINIIQCSNDNLIDLSGIVSGPTTTGMWSGGTGTFANDTDLSTIYNASATELSAGSIVLTLTSTNNQTCLAVSDNIQINFVLAPTANFSANNGCLGTITNFNNTSLTGFGTLTNWNWDFGDSGTSSNEDETHVFLNSQIHQVQLIVTNSNGCIDTIVKAVNIFPRPTADFTYTASCPNNNIILNFSDASTAVGLPINYFYYDFAGQGIQTTEDPVQQFNGSGNYNVIHIVRTSNNCADTIIKLISIPDLPLAGFYTLENNGSNIGTIINVVDTSQNASLYLYTFGNGLSASNQNPAVTYFNNQIYEITQVVTGVFGCKDSTSVFVQINNVVTEIEKLIPNAISPNGDLDNDIWKLEFIPILYKNATVQVFNSWGQEIFKSNGYEKPFDGTYKGEILPDGNYYYVIKLNANLEKDLFKGSLLIFKN